ncbi:MAG: ABC transporter ATP-binding protein [Patescibacteria group bacterium]|jgi:ABC-2 type transport system ATP-binding protein
MSVISVKNLVKHFGQVKAVDGVSFEIEQGEVFGFLGPNGAGKTTTIRCMMDFIRPTSGSIDILGLNAQKNSTKLKRRIGFLSGYVRLCSNWTGEEHINFAKNLNGEHDDSTELVARFNFDPTKKAKSLSSGNRQKLGLILALFNQPEVIIMDEPTNALDPLLQNEVYQLLDEAKKRGATVFMSSHNLAEVDRVCTKVCVIKEGKAIATESINNLKQKRLYSVHAHFAKTAPTEAFQKIGATILEQRNDYLTLKIKGNIEPVIKLLGTFPLRDLQIQHASLEEIFMEYYR